MTITVDARENLPVFQPPHGADFKAFLDAGNGWSYDFRVDLPFVPPAEGRSYKVERKSFVDGLASWLDDDKLARQCSYVDALVLEFDPVDIEFARTRYKPEIIERFMKHVARMSANEGGWAHLWVLSSLGPENTLSLMRYVEKGSITRARKAPKTSPKV